MFEELKRAILSVLEEIAERDPANESQRLLFTGYHQGVKDMLVLVIKAEALAIDEENDWLLDEEIANLLDGTRHDEDEDW